MAHCQPSNGLAATLREVFGSFGIPDTITTDGGPEFTAHSTAEFLDSWGVQHRICSAYTPHSNNRAETGVKSMKRLIAGNTGPGGALKTSFYKALLTYRNSPCPDTRVSPAMCVLGRATRDLIPTLPSRLQPPTNPSENKRQAALQRRQALANARWQEHSVATGYTCRTSTGTTRQSGTRAAPSQRCCSTISTW